MPELIRLESSITRISFRATGEVIFNKQYLQNALSLLVTVFLIIREPQLVTETTVLQTDRTRFGNLRKNPALSR